MAYTDYDIAVQACTKECSKPMKTKLKTTIGAPGNFSHHPTVETYQNNLLKNYTSATVRWDEPTFRGGDLDYYEFKTKITSRDGAVTEKIIKTRNQNCFLEELCAHDGHLYDFTVRAVNMVLTPHSKESPPIIQSSTELQTCDRDDPLLIKSLSDLKLVDPHSWFLPGPWSPAASTTCQYNGSNSLQALSLIHI